MTDARLNREALVVPVGDNDPDARLNREALVVGHTLPATEITARLVRLGLIIVLSRPHGWDIFDDPAILADYAGGPVSGGGDDITPPAIPTGLAAIAGDTEIFLTWTANEELDLASYKVYQATESEVGPYLLIATVDTADAAVMSLINGFTYWFKISAVDTTGNESELSVNVSAVPTTPPVGVPPPVPTGLTAAPGDTLITLAWTAVAASDFSHYNVYRATSSGGTYTLLTTRTVNSHVDVGLTNGTALWYKVSSEDVDGNESALSAFATATPVANTGGGLPTPDVIFNTGNPYTATKVTDEAAGTCFQFTITGGTGGGPRYENAAIPTEAGNQYIFDPGTVLDGNLTTVLAFTGTAADVEIYDCQFTAYLGQNASGVNNTKGGGAIRLRSGWQLIRPYGHHNKYTAVKLDGSNSSVTDGRLMYNGEFGAGGAGSTTGCIVDGNEIAYNGGGLGLDLGGDQGGTKFVHSDGLQFTNNHVHHNLGSATQGGNGCWYDINNINGVIAFNDIHDNTGAGIFYEVSLGAEIHHNTLTNNGRDYAAANPGSAWPVSSQIQISNSGGNGLWIHHNTLIVDGTTPGRGFHGITMFNSNHFQWTHAVISNGCLGTRNLLIEDNTITMSGSQWKTAMAITGTLPTSRSGDQFCGQVEITASGSNNRIRNNTESLTGGAFPSTPYFRSGARVSASQWVGFGYS